MWIRWWLCTGTTLRSAERRNALASLDNLDAEIGARTLAP